MNREEAKRYELELAQFWRIQKARAAALAEGGPHDPEFLETRAELQVLRMHSKWPSLHTKIDDELARGAELRRKATLA